MPVRILSKYGLQLFCILLAVIAQQLSIANPGSTTSRIFKPADLSDEKMLARPIETHSLASVGLLDIRELEEKEGWDKYTPDHNDAFAISPDGQWLAFASNNSYDEGISVWNLKTLTLQYVLKDNSFESNFLNFSTYIHFIPNTNWLVTTSPAALNSVASPDERKTALCPNCQSVTNVWDLKQGKRVLAIGSKDREKGHYQYIGPDGNIYRLQSSGKIEIWNVEAAKKIDEIPSGDASFNSGVLITGNNKDTVVTISTKPGEGEFARDQNWLNIYSIKTKKLRYRIELKRYTARAEFIDAERLAVMTSLEDLVIWNTKTGKIDSTWKPPASGRSHYAQDGNWLTYNGNDLLAIGMRRQGGGPDALELWDTRTGKVINTLNACAAVKNDKKPDDYQGSTFPVAFQNNTLITLSRCVSGIQVWDIEKAQIRGIIKYQGKGNWYRLELSDQLSSTYYRPVIANKPEGFCDNFLGQSQIAREQAAAYECRPAGVSWQDNDAQTKKWCEIHTQEEAEGVLATYGKTLLTCLNDALFNDIKKGNHHKVSMWLDKGADPRYVREDRNDHSNVLYYLMQGGYKPGQRDAFIAAMRELLKTPQSLRMSPCNGCAGTAISAAVELKDAKALKLLLAEGKADSSEVNSSGEMREDYSLPLFIAIHNKDYDSVDVLLSHGATADNYVEPGNNPLLIALKSGQIRVAKRLLSAGAKANVGTEGVCKGEMPLTRAKNIRAQKKGLNELITMIQTRQTQHCP